MSDALARAKQLGEQVEDLVTADVDDLDSIEEDDAHVDAIALEAVTIPAGVEVEIKACARRISDGSTDRRGRFYLRRAQHEALLDRGAWYLFVVYEGDVEQDGEIEEVVAMVAIPARVVDELVSTWTDAGPGRGEATQITWSRLIDLE